MKKNYLFIALAIVGFISFSFITKSDKSGQVEYKVVTVVESIVPNGLGRSRMIFQNIAANDAVMTSKVNDMVTQGWELAFINTGVESEGGKGDGKGIFITRYTFKRTL